MIRHALSASLLTLAAASPATILDFEHLSGGTLSSDGQYMSYAAPLSTGGYRFTGSGSTFMAYTARNSSYTGSMALVPPGSVGKIGHRNVTNDPGGWGTFDVISLDVSPYFAFGSHVVISGTLATGGTVRQTSYPGSFFDFNLHTVALSGFTRLTSLTISETSSTQRPFVPEPYQFDNLNVVANPVPEPASLAALGLGTLRLLGRRRKA